LAQTAGLLVFLTMNVYPDENTQFFFVGMDEVRFRRPVVPGDQLMLKATLERTLRGIWKFQTVAEVQGKEVTGANMLITPGKQ